jgi:hypothetical protein
MVCFASQWIGIQSWVHHDSIHQCGADSAILNGWSASRKVSGFHARFSPEKLASRQQYNDHC